MFESFAARETPKRAWSRRLRGLGAALALALAATIALYPSWLPSCSSSKSQPTARVYTAIGLPGMAIDAPGTVVKEGGYAKGGIHGATRGDVRLNRFELAWNPGGDADEATARAIASAMVAKLWSGATPSITTRALDIGGHPGMRLLAEQGDRVMVIALAACGDRGIPLIVEGDPAAAEIADHMIASFTCTPDPSKDVFASEVAFAVSPSWQRRPHTQVFDGPDELDVRYVGFAATGADSVADQVQRYVAKDYQLTTPSSSRGDKVFWTGTRPVDGKPVPIGVLAWRCSEQRLAMAVVDDPSNRALDEGVAFATTGRCVAPDHSNE